MTSIEKAVIVAAVIVAMVAPIVLLTWRYKRYEERRARGKRNMKPVWKPFWME